MLKLTGYQKGGKKNKVAKQVAKTYQKGGKNNEEYVYEIEEEKVQ